MDPDEEENKEDAADRQFNFELFSTLKTRNGRGGDDIVTNMLIQAFAEGDDEKVKNSLKNYLHAIYEAKLLTK